MWLETAHCVIRLQVASHIFAGHGNIWLQKRRRLTSQKKIILPTGEHQKYIMFTFYLDNIKTRKPRPYVSLFSKAQFIYVYSGTNLRAFHNIALRCSRTQDEIGSPFFLKLTQCVALCIFHRTSPICNGQNSESGKKGSSDWAYFSHPTTTQSSWNMLKIRCPDVNGVSNVKGLATSIFCRMSSSKPSSPV